MKKRILALALAATTAFSMFGASLSASAAVTPDEEAYVEYTSAASMGTAAFDENKTGLDAFLAKFNFAGIGESIVSEDPAGVVYVSDYYGGSNDAADKEALYNALQDLSTITAENKDALNAAVNAAIGALTKEGTLDITASSAARRDYYTNVFVSVKNEAVKSLDASAWKDQSDTSVYKTYLLDELLADFKAVTSATATSEMVNLVQEYQRLQVLLDIAVPDTKTAEEIYYETLDKFDAYVASDYTDASWAQFQSKLDLAAYYAGVENFAEANKTLDGADKLLRVLKPDVTALKELIASLFVDGKIPASYAVYAGTADAADNYVYIAPATFDKYSDWAKFAGSTETAGKYYVKDAIDNVEKAYDAAYPAAYNAYRNVVFAMNGGKYTQTKIDTLVLNLENAIANLNKGAASENWKLVRLGETIDAAYTKLDTDYKTTSSYWKNFVNALEKAEAVYADSTASGLAVDRANTTLTTAMNNLSNCRLTVPAATKAALKTAIAEADKALKVTTGKTTAQVDALKAARAAAYAIYTKATATISEVEGQTAALTAAVKAYNVVEGWNKLADGSYMYGTADGYVTSDWKWIGGAWYYFDANGIMATGWQQLDGAWYYFYTWGGMAKGWAQVNGTWYYLNPNGGKMLSNGWNWIDGKCYYFYSWGGMAANTTIDGYKVDASGAWVK